MHNNNNELHNSIEVGKKKRREKVFVSMESVAIQLNINVDFMEI